MPRPGGSDDSASWYRRSYECHVSWEHLNVVQGVFGTIGDVYLLAVPIQSIFRLKLPVERKIRVGAIFMIGVM